MRIEAVSTDVVHMHVSMAEMRVRYDGPGMPRVIAKAESELQDGAIVPAKRTPADVARRVRPGNPCRCPRMSRNPKPCPGRETPATVVMCRPGPRSCANPGPSVRAHRDPAPLIVRTPSHGN